VRQDEVVVHFKAEAITVHATVGEVLWDVAQRGGVEIATGCHQGNCGLCEVRIGCLKS
jgi:ferredoxin